MHSIQTKPNQTEPNNQGKRSKSRLVFNNYTDQYRLQICVVLLADSIQILDSLSKNIYIYCMQVDICISYIHTRLIQVMAAVRRVLLLSTASICWQKNKHLLHAFPLSSLFFVLCKIPPPCSSNPFTLAMYLWHESPQQWHGYRQRCSV